MDKVARLEKIINFVKTYGSISNSEAQGLTLAHRNTSSNDLNYLCETGKIISIGKGKGTRYRLKELVVFAEKDIENLFTQKEQTTINTYFKNNKRVKSFFNKTFQTALNAEFSFNKDIENSFNKSLFEIDKRRKELSQPERKRKKEKLTIDLSWASSRIEGNTYSLLETEILLKHNQTPQGKKFEEAKMILNHKTALDFIRDNQTLYKKLTKSKVMQLHQLLIDDIGVGTGFRSHLVEISNSNFIPCDNVFQITDFFESIMVKVNMEKSILTKSVILNLLIAYLQPFSDGNKRTSRMLGNAILLSNNYLPISFAHTSREEYIKSILIFYEKQETKYFKQLFLKELNNSFIEYLA